MNTHVSFSPKIRLEIPALESRQMFLSLNSLESKPVAVIDPFLVIFEA